MVYDKRNQDLTEAAPTGLVTLLARHISRLQVVLQEALGARSGPEEGSDAWLLLNALVGGEQTEYIARFEQSGRALAEQGGKLEARLHGLQICVNALVEECRLLFVEQPHLQFEAISLLWQLHSDSQIGRAHV